MQSYYVSLFRIPIHEKQEKGKGKREKGERGSELYMGQGELCKHIECVEGKRFLQKKSLPFLHNKRETEMTNSITLNTLFPLKLFHQ